MSGVRWMWPEVMWKCVLNCRLWRWQTTRKRLERQTKGVGWSVYGTRPPSLSAGKDSENERDVESHDSNGWDECAGRYRSKQLPQNQVTCAFAVIWRPNWVTIGRMKLWDEPKCMGKVTKRKWSLAQSPLKRTHVIRPAESNTFGRSSSHQMTSGRSGRSDVVYFIVTKKTNRSKRATKLKMVKTIEKPEVTFAHWARRFFSSFKLFVRRWSLKVCCSNFA